MAGPYTALRLGGRVVLAWGSDELRAGMVRGSAQPFDIVVLTAEGIQDPSHRLEQQGYAVVRCGYEDNGNLAQAQRTIERCAPSIAASIRRGKRVLILCAAGQNRSALMTAKVRHLVTGEPGAAIVPSMWANDPRDAQHHAFTNGVFRRHVLTWPVRQVAAVTKPSILPIVLGVGAIVTAIGLVALTLKVNKPKRRRNYRRSKSSRHSNAYLRQFAHVA